MCLIREVKFNHSAVTIGEALGISKERAKELNKYLEMLMCEETPETISEIIEIILTNDELSDHEKIGLLYLLGRKRWDPLMCIMYHMKKREKRNNNIPPIFN